jgi:hypothetical protein
MVFFKGIGGLGCPCVRRAKIGLDIFRAAAHSVDATKVGFRRGLIAFNAYFALIQHVGGEGCKFAQHWDDDIAEFMGIALEHAMIIISIVVIDGFKQRVIKPVDRSAIAREDICDILLVTEYLKSFSVIHVRFLSAKSEFRGFS